jgi:ribonuclease D
LTELAFDLESHNVSKSQITCLFQLATSDGKEYVIDTLAPKVWEGVGGLAPIFADPNIVKIGHGIGSLDVRSLHRDFGIFVVNAFDTYEAAIVLNLPGKGLAKVCTHYGLTSSEAYVQLKASYQACDWTQRPLEDPQILYGRYDIHYLIQLRRLMMRDLAKYECWGEEEEVRLVGSTIASILKSFDKDERHEDYDISGFITPSNSSIAGEGEELKDSIIEGDDPKMDRKVETLNRVRRSLFGAKELRMVSDLMRVIDKSQRNCLKLWTGGTESHLNDSSFQSMVIRSKKSEKQDEWTPSKLVLYERLARWREEMAKEEKCCAGFICPLSFLVLVALKQPTSKTGLRQLSFQLPEFFENESANDLFQLVVESRLADGKKENADCDIPLYQEYITRKIQGFSGLEVSAEYSSSSSSSSITRGSTVVCLSLVVAIGAIVLSRGIRK